MGSEGRSVWGEDEKVDLISILGLNDETVRFTYSR